MASEVHSNQFAYDEAAKPFRGLALDGGGMRGLYTANVLNALAERFAETNRDGADFDIGRNFDLIVGASTGGILACGLAAGISCKKLSGFHELYGPKIFGNPVPTASPVKMAFFAWKHRSTSFNSDVALREALHATFQDRTFASVYDDRKIALCIPAVDMSTHNAWVFKTGHLEGKHRDDNTTLVDASLATAAAPFFFPLSFSATGNGKRPFVDGGIFANSPILIAIIEALAITQSEPLRPIDIVSVGTCPPPAGNYADEESRTWGLRQWQLGKRLIEMILDVQVSAHLFMTRMLLPHLNRRVRIIRFEQTHMPDSEAEYLGLDLATPKAIEILKRRALSDALLIHSAAKEPGNPSAFVRDIFSSTPTL